MLTVAEVLQKTLLDIKDRELNPNLSQDGIFITLDEINLVVDITEKLLELIKNEIKS